MSSFWNAFFILLIWVPVVVLWIAAVMDIFRRPDISGLHRALWIGVVLVLPIIGTLVYLVIRPPGTTAQELALAEGRPVQGSANELATLADLHDRGKLSDDEFRAEKSRIVGAGQVAPASVAQQRGGQLL